MKKTEKTGSGKGLVRIVFGRTMVVILLLCLNFVLTFCFLFRLVRYIPIFVGSSAVLVAVMCLVILNTRDGPEQKLSWCVLIGVMPVFGTLLYLFVGLDLGHRYQKKVVEQAIREGKNYAPPENLEQIKQLEPDFYGTAVYLQNTVGLGICQNTKVTYFPVGEQMLEAMLQQLKKAEKFIFLEYFIIGKGYMWDSILSVLKEKAAQGVQVRVLYDGTCAVTLLPYGYPKELEKMGIACKMFSPLRPFVSTHYNNRDHRKICVIDGVTAFTGGINLSDEYINHTHPYGHWKDTAVMLQGEGAVSFTLMFLQMWNAGEKEPVYAPYLTHSSEIKAPGYVIAYGDSPTDRERVGETVYLDMLNRARDYVYIMTPYLILDVQMVEALTQAAKRGVDVRLLQPEKPDHIYAYVLARRHFRELMEAGVKIYNYTPGFVHSKVFLSDDTKAVVGTINLDYRSLYLHYECAAYLYKVPALKDISRDFRETFAISRLLTAEDLKKEGYWSRFFGVLLKPFAPLM